MQRVRVYKGGGPLVRLEVRHAAKKVRSAAKRKTTRKTPTKKKTVRKKT